MGKLGLAFGAFFRILGDARFAQDVQRLKDGGPAQPARVAPMPAEPAAAAPPAAKVEKPAPRRSDALTLLEVLQREGRLIDFLKENLSTYSDAQIGAAARDVHRDTAAALERMFAIRPLRAEAEGSSVEIPAGFDAGQVRLTGNVAGTGPYRGTIRHAGWVATRAELPEWTGTQAAGRTVASAEVEVA